MFTAILSGACIYMAVLFIASLSGLVSEKAGIVNIGINGMMVIGALMFRIFANLFHGQDHLWTMTFAIISSVLITGIFALLHGLATIVFKADHVVSGTAINLLAAGLALFLTPIIAHNLTDSPTFKQVYIFKNIGTTSLSPIAMIYFVISVVIAVKTWVYFKYTKVGIRHAAIGENPNAADSASIKVVKYKWLAVFSSGIFAGFAGIIALSKIGEFSGNVQGLGFVALAIMILGQWRVPLIFVSSMIFALLWEYISVEKGLFGLPRYMVSMIPFVLSIVTLMFTSKYQTAPKAAGQHFDKAKR